MKLSLYKQLIKHCGSEPQLLRFLGALNLMCEAVVYMGKQAKKMRKSVHPDMEQIDEIQSSRLFLLLSFLKYFEDDIKKLNKNFIWKEEEYQQLFENMH